MNLQKLEEIIKVSLDTKVSIRGKYSYKELFSALLSSKTIPEAASLLNTSTDALEHVLSRNVRKLFPTKVISTKWNNYLYSLLGYRRCTGCDIVLELSNFSKKQDSFDGYAYYCKECRSVTRKYFSENNPEYARQDYLKNKSEYISRAIKYRTRRELATPPWANLEIIARIYDCAEEDHVDHIVPLQGDMVCGLHVENNLQYLSVEENLRKSNKFVTDWE